MINILHYFRTPRTLAELKISMKWLNFGQKQMISAQVNYLTYHGVRLEQTAWCSIPFTEESVASLYMMAASTVVYFIFPLIFVATMYIRWGIFKYSSTRMWSMTSGCVGDYKITASHKIEIAFLAALNLNVRLPGK